MGESLLAAALEQSLASLHVAIERSNRAKELERQLMGVGYVWRKLKRYEHDMQDRKRWLAHARRTSRRWSWQVTLVTTDSSTMA